jgi:hypothetical protein
VVAHKVYAVIMLPSVGFASVWLTLARTTKALGTGPDEVYVKGMSALTATLIGEIKSAPEAVQREVLDYLTYLKSRHTGSEPADNLLPLAETAWAADWNTPEEDAAWRDL